MASLGSSRRPVALGLDIPQRDDPKTVDLSHEPNQPSGHAASTSKDSGIAFQPPTPLSPLSAITPSSAQPSRHSRETSGDHGEATLDLPVAGPSHSHGITTGSVPIPPPPNPRRHRSGVLMSRVRANSSGTNFKPGGHVVGSRSFGDLNLSMSMSSIDPQVPERSRSRDRPAVPGDDENEGMNRGKRIVSEGQGRASDDEGSMWDNSARFYHHLHSRPASRAASRTASPTQSPSSLSLTTSPSTSTSTSPIYVRRALTQPLNQDVSGPHALGLSASLSPNHHFLQQHLPPTFPSPTDNLATDHVHHHCHAHPHPSMVILTPTTQEWRELKEIRRLEGEDVDSSEEMTSSLTSASDESRRSSVLDDGSLESSVLFGRNQGSSAYPQAPRLRTTTSVDYLPEEAIHTPDPGSPVLTAAQDPSPERPVFNPVIIAPSPHPAGEYSVPATPDTPTAERHARKLLNADGAEDGGTGDERAPQSSPEIDDGETIAFPGDHGAPARFNSIGRRESLRAIKPSGDRPGMPRVKTKREREREKLFKEIDEELESDAKNEFEIERPRSGSTVQEFGMGAGLISRPSSVNRPVSSLSDRLDFDDKPAEANLVETKTDIFDRTFEKKVAEAHPISPPTISSSIFRAHPSLSPTQPLKPSPLHASPVNAPSGLPTPETPMDNEPPMMELPSPQQPTTAGSNGQTANLDTIRDYARALASPRVDSNHLRAATGSPNPSPPMSPRQPRSRRRDTNRVSLVAGRVVQPFAIPPSTALPPPERPALNPIASNSSLQSFSPFRSPGLNPVKSPPSVPPVFTRLDSTLSMAPSTGAPSECGTPTSETAGGIGGRGIEDYVILKEAGKGAYGLVMRAKVKGPNGEPVGDEVIIKYIIKARILADCWKKHKQLGPIPVEIHVMDQLRHLLYHPPPRPHPWDPSRPRPDGRLTKRDSVESRSETPDSPRSDASGSISGAVTTQKYIASEIKHAPERGHPNICKLLDFFEDREFYYLVMPRFGEGVDLFDYVESKPDGLDPFEVRSLLGQLADAVRFLHSNGIVHRDIKDENVILDGKGRCQLIDFGSAAHWRPGKRWDTFSGTLHYASPEILRGVAYGGKEQDVWALGVVGYVLLVGETPFADLPDEVLEGLTPDSRAERALEERCGNGHEDEGREADGGGRLEDAGDFVRRCLEMDPSERPSSEVLCQHRYLRGADGWTGKKGWIAKGWK